MTKKNTTEATQETTAGTTQVAAEHPWFSFPEVVGQQMGQMDELIDEMGRRQEQVVNQANQTMGELTRMVQESLKFSHQLSQEWVRAARGTTRWATDMMGSWTR